MADLISDCKQGEARALSFFQGFGHDLFQATPPQGHWDDGFRQELERYQRSLGLERSVPKNSIAIVTGQQPGLLTGPLYTIYKAITAIRLAKRMEAVWERPVVPVFWCGADDHDFEEASVTHILHRKHHPHALRYRPDGEVGSKAMHQTPAEDSLHRLIDEAVLAAPGSELSGEITAFLHDALNQAEHYAHWFSLVMARLFQDTPLLHYTTTLPESRKLASSVLAFELENPLELTRILLDTSARLEAAGYSAQVVKAPEECNFFLEMDGHRRKVIFDGETFVLPEVSRRFKGDELQGLLAEAPEIFSANVVTRPLVQQRLFPTAAYVGGPGEIAYWAQLKEVFKAVGLPMPVVYPRAQAALTTLKTNKLLTRYKLSHDDVVASSEAALLERALRETVHNPALDAFREHRDGVAASVSALVEAVAAKAGKDQGLGDAARTFDTQTHQNLERLERILLHKDETQVQAVQGHIERLIHTFYPERKPQERHYSVFSFLFEHGWELIPKLLEEMDIESFITTVIEL